MLKLIQLARVLEKLYRATPDNVSIDVPYDGMIDAPVNARKLRVYLIDGKSGEVLDEVKDGGRLKDYRASIVLNSLFIVFRYPSPRGHKYHCYTSAALRRYFDPILLHDPSPTGTHVIPPLGTRYIRLRRDYSIYYNSDTDTFPDPHRPRVEVKDTVS